MSWREKDAEERLSRLTRSTDEGLVFHPRGASGAGYVVDAPTARRIKTYFAYYLWVIIAVIFCTSQLIPEWLHSHIFFASAATGLVGLAVDRLIMLCLLWRCPRASTGDFPVPPPEPYSRLQISCGLVNIGIVFALLVFLALVSRSIDAWLCAAVCGTVLAYALLPKRRRRQSK